MRNTRVVEGVGGSLQDDTNNDNNVYSVYFIRLLINAVDSDQRWHTTFIETGASYYWRTNVSVTRDI